MMRRDGNAIDDDDDADDEKEEKEKGDDDNYESLINNINNSLARITSTKIPRAPSGAKKSLSWAADFKSVGDIIDTFYFQLIFL